ncbi:MAG: hypothetical protein AB7V13_18275 [Pseudorhodoplanes sp.]|uniref:hypothetical protein n=1 Tax=Pseudorhodoplanes sp. TaxID=1934341 RepID=UPI003D0AECF7
MKPGIPVSAQRVGGELPIFSDRTGRAQSWRSGWLAFSHGRAALAWLLARRPARSALICAYTCPTVPAFLRRQGLTIGFYDVGARHGELAALAAQLPGPSLVLVPALFGARPWLGVKALETALPASSMVVVDAAQTAFGHCDYAPSSRGAVLSGPRKTTGLADGAVLALGREFGRYDIDNLPVARVPAALKLAARALFATAIPQQEAAALALNRQSEQSWPDQPHRMTDDSRILLERLDRHWHARRRRSNRRVLAEALRDAVALWKPDSGVPFSLPVFVSDREAVLDRLHDRRIFASALWPDAECDANRHPVAFWIRHHLISLPIDQRHDEVDMRRIAREVRAAARMALAVPQPLSRWIAAATTRSGRHRR